MENILDINPFLAIIVLFFVAWLLVVIVANLPIKIGDHKMPPRKSSSGRSWFSMPYPEDEAWRKYPGFSSSARKNRKRYVERKKREMYGC